MARPMTTPTAETMFNGLIPWNDFDEAGGWHLLHFVNAVTRGLAEIDDLVRDREYAGWSRVLDVDRALTSELPYLAQFVGVDLPANASDAAMRSALKETQGFRRGTPLAIAGAARPHLTGNRLVQILERDGSAYRFTVRTFEAETPDPAAVEAALLDAKPAGLVMSYEVISGQTYGQLTATGATYQELSEEYATYSDLTVSLPPVI